MKRHGHLLPRIADPGNLRLAFWKASKGKRGKADCRAFQENLDVNLGALRADDVQAGFVGVGARAVWWRRSGRPVVPGAEVAKDLLGNLWVVNDRDDAHRALAHRTA